MNKLEFNSAVTHKLKSLPQDDINKSLEFYNEMIDDRMEEGVPEEEAVAAVGTPDEVANAILSEIPLLKLVKAKSKVKKQTSKRSVWHTVLIWAGSPVWFSLAVAAACILLCAFIVIWTIPFSFWIAEIAIGGSAIGFLGYSLLALINDSALTALAFFGGSLCLAGITTAGAVLCIKLSALFVKSSKLTVKGLKIMFMGGKKQ